jgi:hypothetical protein
MAPPPLANFHRDRAVRGEGQGGIYERLIDIRLPSEHEKDVHLAQISLAPQHLRLSHIEAFTLTAGFL